MGKIAKMMKKKKQSGGGRTSETSSEHGRSADHARKVFDEDTAVFVDMSRELKEQGNKLFQKRDYEGAILKYEKAIKLLPGNHIDVACLRSNLAACYMQMSPEEYHRAIDECNLALEISPKYTKALLKRARCFEAVNQLELACKDVHLVLSLEPNNLTALDFSEQVKKEMEMKGIKFDDKKEMEMKGIKFDDKTVVLPQEVKKKVVKEKNRKKKSHKVEEKVVMEVHDNVKKEEVVRAMKLVFGEDIRYAGLPSNCSVSQLREIVRNRFPSLKAVLIKYKDKEGDLVTITNLEELRWAEESQDPQGSLRLYITEVNPVHEPLFEEERKGSEVAQNSDKNSTCFSDNGAECIDSWIVQFAQLFKNHVGFNSDECLDLNELGMKLYCEAMEDAFTSEEAMEIFEIAEDKFQEMVALALFNWGNVHVSRARKKLILPEDASKESILELVKPAYEWAQGEYVKAGEKYRESLKIKPDFYEGFLALGHQQFEQAKLSWCYAVGSNVALDTWPTTNVLELFNSAEDNMERGMEMWEVIEEKRLKNLNKPNKEKEILKKMALDALFKDVSNDEAAERSSNMRTQIHLLWGTMLYERSIAEFKLGFLTWEECLLASVEKFKLAGASPADLAVMIKNHIANETTQEGLGFKIDEIVQAWHDMYDSKRWLRGVPSFRLEPLFQRRVPKLHNVLEHI